MFMEANDDQVVIENIKFFAAHALPALIDGFQTDGGDPALPENRRAIARAAIDIGEDVMAELQRRYAPPDGNEQTAATEATDMLTQENL